MKIITELTLSEFNELQKSVDGTIILKFSAKWCSPCSRIEPNLRKYMRDIETAGLPFTFCFLDIDISQEIYRHFKTKKIATGIPTIMSFHKGNDSFYPDNVSIGADIPQIDDFFRKEIQWLSSK